MIRIGPGGIHAQQGQNHQIHTEMNQEDYLPSFAHPLDAIVLAGMHRDSTRTLKGQNKAFLILDDRPLLRHVVDALLGAQSIGDIFVVGPVEQMSKILQSVPAKVHLVQQEGNMLANCWAGARASEERQTTDSKEDPLVRPYLLISSDLPLISSISVDDYVAHCAAEDQASDTPYGLMVGVADEAGLTPFYPDGEKPGIVRPLVELEFARVRLANIYVVRPRQLAHEEFLQTGFSHRKAVDWRNVASLLFRVLSQKGGWHAAWLGLRLQVTLLAARRGGRLYRWLRRGNTREKIEATTSTIIGGRLRFVTTPFGGLSLDVDDEEDFEVLSTRYHDWMAIHEAVRSEYPLTDTADESRA